MKRPSRFITALALASTLTTSCASLINGTHQSVPVTTEPPGATVTIGGQTYITPADVSLSRNQNFQIVANKEGYETQTAEVRSSFSAITLLDTVFWIPWVVDLVDGAAYKLDPESVELQLRPVHPVAANADSLQSHVATVGR